MLPYLTIFCETDNINIVEVVNKLFMWQLKKQLLFSTDFPKGDLSMHLYLYVCYHRSQQFLDRQNSIFLPESLCEDLFKDSRETNIVGTCVPCESYFQKSPNSQTFRKINIFSSSSSQFFCNDHFRRKNILSAVWS